MTERDITAFTLLPTTTEQKEPKHNSLQKLYCRNGGYHLRIQPNGTVDASRQENDVYSNVILTLFIHYHCIYEYFEKYSNKFVLILLCVSFLLVLPSNIYV
uniref:Uncharacterized protein n=1 Tax=Cyprinus carpio TaxID=7962 RepID=A0A8C1T131_CYPCA